MFIVLVNSYALSTPLVTLKLNLCKKSKEIWLTEMERLTEKNSVRVPFRERTFWLWLVHVGSEM